MTITIDLSTREVHVGDVVLTGVTDASATTVGALRLADGAVLRPLDWGGRAQACLAMGDRRALAAAVAVAAGADEDADAATQALALHLAGASTEGGPTFADVAAVMARVFGWSPGSLLAAPAHVVDRLAASALDTTDGDIEAGWTSLVLVDDPDQPATTPGAGTESVEDLRDRLADDLLHRARAALGPAVVDAAGWPAHPGPGAPATTGPRADLSGTAIAGSSAPTGPAVTGGHVATASTAASPARPAVVVARSDGGQLPTDPQRSDDGSTAARTAPERDGGWAPRVADTRPVAPGRDQSVTPDAAPGIPDMPAVAGRHGHPGPVAVTRTGASPADPPDPVRNGRRPAPPASRPAAPAPAEHPSPPVLSPPAVASRDPAAAAPSRAAPTVPLAAASTVPRAGRHPAAAVDRTAPPLVADTPATDALADRLADALDDESDVRGLLPW